MEPKSNRSVCPITTLGIAPTTFASALQFFTAAQCLLQEDWPENAQVEDYEEFDFIIVGAGTAGSVVANRLSEIPHWNVLLIEAGSDPPVESTVPAFSGSLYGSRYDWQYKTEQDGRTSQANKDETVLWPRGKMLGGSSSINAMIYFRGNKQDYLQWFEEGNKEWHPDIVEEYFKKAESLQDQSLLNKNHVKDFYGRHGPLAINKFNHSSPINDNILMSCEEIGLDYVSDLNMANMMGCGKYFGTASDGSRNSGATSYVNTIKKRKNIKILKSAVVTKVLINPTTKEAYGVIIEQDNMKKMFLVKNEVIISAGAIDSPKLLMLSGVGPKKDLEKLNITCFVDLPLVGKNLQDHLVVPITIYGNETRFPNAEDKYFDSLKYLINRTGFLSQGPVEDISAFYSDNKTAKYPKFQILYKAVSKGNPVVPYYFSTITNYKPSVVEDIASTASRHALFNFIFILLHPNSKGFVKLRSNDFKDKPLITANYFKDSRDLKDAVTGIKMWTKIIETKYFKSIKGLLGRLKWAECNNFELDSEDYWGCICINFVTTIYHPVGTAKMGHDRFVSVVDSRLRVHGVKGLRVVDASIMPIITSGNTNGPVTMIGERASDLIKEDYFG